MRLVVPLIFIIVFVLVTDLYLYKALHLFTGNFSIRTKKILYSIHWLIPVITIAIYFVINFLSSSIRNHSYYGYLFNAFGVFILIYFPKLIFLIFHLIEDIVYVILKSIGKVSKRFLLVSKLGLFISIIPFLLIVYGMIWGRYDFIVRHEKIEYLNLPQSFNKFKIVQFSDLHVGSFGDDTCRLRQIVRLINLQQPDLIVFTGDMVNNFAEELIGKEKIFAELKASYGKYAIMGNHDYGDYYKWTNEKDKLENHTLFLEKLSGLGFKILINSFDSITVENESIALIGVENWGRPPFKQYGNIAKAQQGAEKFRFKILLSHDPDYWEAGIVGKTDIDLTLSGHTHGMQIGWAFNGKRYSPSVLRFKQWGGLYKEGTQYLYVNTGIGFIGLPARIGMPPEITVFTLMKK